MHPLCTNWWQQSAAPLLVDKGWVTSTEVTLLRMSEDSSDLYVDSNPTRIYLVM